MIENSFQLPSAKSLLTIVVLSIIFYGCGNNKLDRGKASKLIIDFYEYPNVELVKFRGAAGSLTQDYQGLIDQGLIYTQEKGFWTNVSYDLFLTDMGKQYLSHEESIMPFKYYVVASNSREFEQITGLRIDEGQDKAIVDFQARRTNVTSFGTFMGNIENELVDYQVNLELYDDGWRVVEELSDNYKESDFKCFSDKASDNEGEQRKREKTTNNEDRSNDIQIPNIEIPQPKVGLTKAVHRRPKFSESELIRGDHPLMDLYIGTIGTADFKFFITDVDGKNQVIQGYSTVNNGNRTTFTGYYKIEDDSKMPSDLPPNVVFAPGRFYHIVAAEPEEAKYSGVFEVSLRISDHGRTGEGTWKSYDGNLYQGIEIVTKL